VQSLEREQPKNSSQALGLVLETEGAEGIMGFLVLLIVAIGTTTLAVSAATGILHLLFQFMETAALPQRAIAADVRAGGSAVHIQTAD
jgi:hypothetical protein